jgi:hypothetical protein
MTTCLITAGSQDKRIEAVQTRLTSAFNASSRLSAARYNAADPLFVPILISHECFMQSGTSVFGLGKRLYDSLDIVDAAAETVYDRNTMKSLTFKLHQISQDADSLIQSADTGIALMDRLRLAQERLVYFSDYRERQAHAVHQCGRLSQERHRGKKTLATGRQVTQRDSHELGVQSCQPERSGDQHGDRSGHKERQLFDEGHRCFDDDFPANVGSFELLRHGILRWASGYLNRRQ